MNKQESANQPAETAPTHAAVPAHGYLAALRRLWVLKPLRAAPSGKPTFAILAVGAAWLLLWIAVDWWESQPDPQFIFDGIPLLAWYVLGTLSLAALLRSRSSPVPERGGALALAVGLVPLPLLLMTLGADYLSPSWFLAAGIAVAVYALVYLSRSLHAVTGKSQRMAALTGVAFIAGFIWLSDTLNVIPDVWAPRETHAAIAHDASADAETILFAQAARIDRALAAIDVKPGSTSGGSAPKPRAFFLGFAGVGEQKVFAQEIGLAARVLGERYDIDGRSLSLVNDQRDLDGAPLATVSGLKYALRRLASRMNLDQDVLFLSLSSHGSEDPAIAVSNSQLPLDDLSDEDLVGALRDSGIKWRVIIISACYAGGFIDSLRNPRTIVIAAAAADRTSFGCSNDSDLTYFGEAFYRDALPGSSSLREAFDKAKAAIAARERGEHITASNPQAYFGQDITAKLAAMDAARR